MCTSLVSLLWEQFISIRDEEGEEIGLIRDLSELDPVSRKAVQEELNWRYFTPKIQRITSIKKNLVIPIGEWLQNGEGICDSRTGSSDSGHFSKQNSNY